MEKKLRELIKEAMLEKNKIKQMTYKNILDNAQKIAKQTNSNVSDEMVIKAVKNEIKQLNDLMIYCKEDVKKTSEIVTKIQYCEILLPTMASEDEIKLYLETINLEKNIGVCMKELKAHFGSALDGRLAQQIVKEYIN